MRGACIAMPRDPVHLPVPVSLTMPDGAEMPMSLRL
jgi:hypothetical protein